MEIFRVAILGIREESMDTTIGFVFRSQGLGLRVGPFGPARQQACGKKGYGMEKNMGTTEGHCGNYGRRNGSPP